MNIISDYKFKKTVVWVLSMVFSFTSYVSALIYIKKSKFFYYATWMYKGDFKDSAWVLKVYNYYHQTEISHLYWWLLGCIILDIVLRRMILPSVRKPQHTV